MKYGIFSDIHSNIEALDVVLKEIQKEKVDEIICCGDIVGYNANPEECVSRIVSLGIRSVMGNHDMALVEPTEDRYFNHYGLAAIKWQRSQVTQSNQKFIKELPSKIKVTEPNLHDDFQVTHGSLDPQAPFEYIASPLEALRMSELMLKKICFIGHSHISGIFTISPNDKVEYFRASHGHEVSIDPKEKYIINVGSVGQPRDRNPQSAYAIYDTEKNKITIKRVDYDIETTISKVMDAGLPLFLADRLRIGW